MTKFIGACSGLLALSIFALNAAEEDTVNLTVIDDKKLDFSKLDIIQKPEHLSRIKLVENRFRIDEYVDELVLVLFRDGTTAPSILIKPDGSKLYAATMPPEQGDWFYDTHYDMVRLQKPMPGPWQVVASLTDKSEIMVMSDVHLTAEKIPHDLFVGENLSLTAKINNAGKEIPYQGFSDVVRMSVTMVSTHNDEYDNFSSQPVRVASFEDDGLGYDQHRKDGVFTGTFKLALTPGEWRPELFVDLALFNREFSLPPVMIHPLPFKLEFIPAEENNQQHTLNITADSELIDFSTFVFNGTVYYPNGDSESFAISEPQTNQHEMQLYNYQQGNYRIKLDAFGKTTDGRDLILDVPEQAFVIEAPEPVIVEAEKIENADEINGIATDEILEPQDSRLSNSSLLTFVILGNLLVLSLCLLAFWLVVKKGLSFSSVWSRAKKIFKMRKKAKSNEKHTETDEIVDLRMPEEI
ncbi:TIGR03503 family protein [Gayadomonas joobiniege]|uniref:TIGR03503 family protein n=1 Tax=Gayadomonas joobiniege TaxID=1234606 RepID=UPI000362A2A7|nr:TIGR03503 family protein [Gayadomonas joobiniege]